MHQSSASYLESTRQRLLSRTEKTATCWLWTGAKGTSGYGHLYFIDRVIGTHRVAWILKHGPIPDGHVIAHHCDVKLCVNPAHLFLTTDAGNLADMRAKARHSHGPNHGAAIKAGWTPELRHYRAAQTRERMRQQREAAALAAGASPNSKHCPACDTWKPRSDFNRNAARHDGLKSKCKPCSTIETRELRWKRRLQNS